MRNALAATMLSGLLAVTSGCSTGNVADQDKNAHTAGSAAEQDVIIGEADELLPGSTIADWRIYADHLTLVRVDAIADIAPSEDEVSADEGYIGRALTFTVIDVLWSRDGANPAPHELELELDGWSFHGDQRTPVRFAGEPMIIKGGTYLMPIVQPGSQGARANEAWSNLSIQAIVPVQAGVVGAGDKIVGGDEARSQAALALWGKTPRSAAALLRLTEIPASAKPFMSLPPVERMREIAKNAQ